MDKPSLHASCGTPNDSWRATLATFAAAFESDRKRFRDLMHYIILATDAHRDRLTGPPRIRGPAMAVYAPGSAAAHRVLSSRIGTAFQERGPFIVPAGQKRPPRPRMVLFSGGFYGCGDNLARANEALVAFGRLSAGAWSCLPETVRESLVLDSYVDPNQCHDPGLAWLLSLYVLAWRKVPGSGIRAPRRATLGNGKEHSSMELEYLIDLPDPVPLFQDPEGALPIPGFTTPSRPKSEIVAEALAGRVYFNKRTSPTWAKVGVTVPPAWFDSFLEPDVFLASKLAADFLGEDARTAPAGGVAQESPTDLMSPDAAAEHIDRKVATIRLWRGGVKIKTGETVRLIDYGHGYVSRAELERMRELVPQRKPRPGPRGKKAPPKNSRADS